MSSRWVSETIQINSDTSADVSADSQGVVLGQHGEAWLEDLHLNPEQAVAVGMALIQGAVRCLTSQVEGSR